MVRDDRPGYWRATRTLMGVVIVLWLVLGPAAYLVAAGISDVSVLGAPVGYLLAGLGSPFALVGLVFWFADRQDRIDREFGMAEED